MRYVTIYRPTSGEEGAMPTPEHMAQMNALIERMAAAGVFISTEPFAAREHCARVTLGEDGKFTVAEETERAAGFAILQYGSKAEAIEGCKEFLRVMGGGTVEMRQILEFAPQPQPA